MKKTSIYNLCYNKLRVTGRNNHGNIIIYHRGGGNKQLYRFIDTSHYIWNIYGIIISRIYDPNRTASLIGILYTNGILSYSLSIIKIRIGFTIISGALYKKTEGCASIINELRTGTFINSIPLSLHVSNSYCRVNGSRGRIPIKTNNKLSIRLRSNYVVKFINTSIVIVGSITKKIIENTQIYRKASYYIYMGWRPSVRGVAMNPIDHPHGGGQGKTSGGRPSCNKKGIYTKGTITRNLRHRNNYAHTKKKKKYG